MNTKRTVTTYDMTLKERNAIYRKRNTENMKRNPEKYRASIESKLASNRRWSARNPEKKKMYNDRYKDKQKALKVAG